MTAQRHLARAAAALALLCAPAIVSAKENTGQQPSPPPSMAQLLEQPPVSEIVSRFVAACVDNAGNPRAQEAAGRRLGITWPYQLFVRRTDQGDECAIASTVADGGTTATLGVAVQEALAARGLAPIEARGGAFATTLTVGNRRYDIDGNIERMNDSPMMVAVVLLTDAARARRR